MKAGYYPDMPMATYLADPCVEPSLSTGSVWTLYNLSARKAKREHPRFGGKGEPSTRGDLGSAVHSLALGGNEVVFCDVIHKETGVAVTDWRTKAAQEFQDKAREAGKLALLEKQREDIAAAVITAGVALGEHGPGEHEVTMIFQWEGVWFRARADQLTPEWDDDLKTCDVAERLEWARKCVYQGGLDIQAAIRWIGHRVLGEPRRMAWLPVELTGDDYSVIEASEELLQLAERKVRHAAKLWRRGLDSGVFPGYDKEPMRLQPPAFAAMDLDARGIE